MTRQSHFQPTGDTFEALQSISATPLISMSYEEMRFLDYSLLGNRRAASNRSGVVSVADTASLVPSAVPHQVTSIVDCIFDSYATPPSAGFGAMPTGSGTGTFQMTSHPDGSITIKLQPIAVMQQTSGNGAPTPDAPTLLAGTAALLEPAGTLPVFKPFHFSAEQNVCRSHELHLVDSSGVAAATPSVTEISVPSTSDGQSQPKSLSLPLTTALSQDVFGSTQDRAIEDSTSTSYVSSGPSELNLPKYNFFGSYDCVSTPDAPALLAGTSALATSSVGETSTHSTTAATTPSVAEIISVPSTTAGQPQSKSLPLRSTTARSKDDKPAIRSTQTLSSREEAKSTSNVSSGPSPSASVLSATTSRDKAEVNLPYACVSTPGAPTLLAGTTLASVGGIVGPGGTRDKAVNNIATCQDEGTLRNLKSFSTAEQLHDKSQEKLRLVDHSGGIQGTSTTPSAGETSVPSTSSGQSQPKSLPPPLTTVICPDDNPAISSTQARTNSCVPCPTSGCFPTLSSLPAIGSATLGGDATATSNVPSVSTPVQADGAKVNPPEHPRDKLTSTPESEKATVDHPLNAPVILDSLASLSLTENNATPTSSVDPSTTLFGSHGVILSCQDYMRRFRQRRRALRKNCLLRSKRRSWNHAASTKKGWIVDSSALPRPRVSASMISQHMDSFGTGYKYYLQVLGLGAEPNLTKKGYEISPSIEELTKMSNESLESVSDFVVKRPGYGKIEWESPVDVRCANLDTIVVIEREYISLYGMDDANGVMTPVGTKLNGPATITFFAVFPTEESQETSTHPIADQSTFAERVVKATERMGAEFVSYDRDAGVWIIRVRQAGSFSLNDSSKENRPIVVTSVTTGVSVSVVPHKSQPFNVGEVSDTSLQAEEAVRAITAIFDQTATSTSPSKCKSD